MVVAGVAARVFIKRSSGSSSSSSCVAAVGLRVSPDHPGSAQRRTQSGYLSVFKISRSFRRLKQVASHRGTRPNRLDRAGLLNSPHRRDSEARHVPFLQTKEAGTYLMTTLPGSPSTAVATGQIPVSASLAQRYCRLLRSLGHICARKAGEVAASVQPRAAVTSAKATASQVSAVRPWRAMCAFMTVTSQGEKRKPRTRASRSVRMPWTDWWRRRGGVGQQAQVWSMWYLILILV